jgi:hypothetical protein
MRIGMRDAVVAIAAATWMAAGQAQAPAQRNSLATKVGWELGAQAARYRYEEPGLMRLKGDRAGVAAAYTARSVGEFHARIEARVSYAELDYQGSGTIADVPDHLFELRALFGRDLRAGAVVWVPFVGLGYRSLYNDLRGTSSTGAIGYRRLSRYWYVPMGVGLRIGIGAGLVLAPQIEYDAFTHGKQRSYLGDTGLGFNDVTNRQQRGRGYRAQLMFEGRRWSIGPWMHYWKVRDSDIQPVGLGFVALEPENWTRESGVELRYRF